MKKSNLKYPCLIAALYFGVNVNAQQADSTRRETKIDEVVMIGYGSQRKENVTGSIGVISAKDLADKPNPNPVSSIQGKASGVQILNSGAPGGSPRVDIRGISSMSGKVVFIVDGMITDDISFLSPQDIESMSILKDPSSLAIFGAQASNGAVIIKTKTGKAKPAFNFNTYVGFKTMTNVPKMVNSDQYIELYNEKLRNEGVTDPAAMLSRKNYPANTNWFDEILQTGFIHNTDISGSGKWKDLTYYLSLGYLDDGGNLTAGRGVNSGNDFRKLSSKVNLSYKITPNITIGNNFSWGHINTDKAQNPLQTAFSAPPIYYPVNPGTGNYDYISVVSLANPRAMLDLYRGKDKENRILENAWAEVKFLKDFTFRTSYSMDNRYIDRYDYNAVSNYNPNTQPTISSLEKWSVFYKDYVWDNTLSWKKSFSSNNIELLVGYSQSQNYHNGWYKSARNVAFNGDDSSLDIFSGTDILEKYHERFNETGSKLNPYRTRIQSEFARLNYDFAGRYLLNASVRRDGATGFSDNDRYKVFPAVSAGWVVSREGFMANQKVFDLLKFRASWGRLGNPNVGTDRDYILTPTIFSSGTYFGGLANPAETIDKVVDPSIGWEITEGKDFGVEMAFLRNRVKVEATYFDKDSKDVVYGIQQPVMSGASNYRNFITNAYSFNNKGFEGSVNYDGRLSEKVRFGAYANITTLKNVITDVYGGSFTESGGLFGNAIVRLQKGQAVGSFYGYQVVGVFQNQAQVSAAPVQNGKTVGGFQFQDRDGNGIIDERDKTFLGSPVPKFTYGFGVNFAVSDFDFAVDFQGVVGNKIYNYNREARFGNESWDMDIYNNRWHGEGTSNTYAMVTNNQAIILPSSFYVEDGSYFRIRNVALGYNFPRAVAQSMKMERFRLYLTAQNPFTSFKYHGFSPEIMNSDRVQMGVDNNIYPISAIYTFGMNLTF